MPEATTAVSNEDNNGFPDMPIKIKNDLYMCIYEDTGDLFKT